MRVLWWLELTQKRSTGRERKEDYYTTNRESFSIRELDSISPGVFSTYAMRATFTFAFTTVLSTYFPPSILRTKEKTTTQHSTTLIYPINIPVQLPNLVKTKPWAMACEYFWSVEIVSIDWLDSWLSVRSKAGIKPINGNTFHCSKIFKKHWSRFFSLEVR